MGRPQKLGDRKKITAYIPVELADALIAEAEKQRRTISTVIEQMIRDELALIEKTSGKKR